MAWSPADLTPYGWYDASDTATITDAGSGHCSQITNKSGGGPTLVQATDANRPITASHFINGLNTLNFLTSGSQALTAAAAAPPTTPFTDLWLVRPLSVNALRPFGDLQGGGTVQTYVNNPNYATAGTTAGWDSGRAAVAGEIASLIVVWNGASSAFYVNGVAQSGGTSTSVIDRVLLGAGGGIIPDYDFGERVIVAGVISAANRQNWEDYVNAKWKISRLTLPGMFDTRDL